MAGAYAGRGMAPLDGRGLFRAYLVRVKSLGRHFAMPGRRHYHYRWPMSSRLLDGRRQTP